MIALHFCCHVVQAHTASTKRGYVYMLSLFPGFPLRMDELARSADDLSIRGCVVGDCVVDQGGLDLLEVDSKREGAGVNRRHVWLFLQDRDVCGATAVPSARSPG